MRFVGGVRGQRQFAVAGEFERAGADGAVGHGDAAEFDVVFGGDGDFHYGFDAEGVCGGIRRGRRRSARSWRLDLR